MQCHLGPVNSYAGASSDKKNEDDEDDYENLELND